MPIHHGGIFNCQHYRHSDYAKRSRKTFHTYHAFVHLLRRRHIPRFRRYSSGENHPRLFAGEDNKHLCL